MSASGETSMTFQANTAEAVAALEEAARRSGMQHLSADPATGVLVFTAGGMVLAFGEKVTARIREVAPGVRLQGALRLRDAAQRERQLLNCAFFLASRSQSMTAEAVRSVATLGKGKLDERVPIDLSRLRPKVLLCDAAY